MIFLEAVFVFFCGLSAAFICGYGLSGLIPLKYREYRILACPSIGYVVFSGASYVLSGSTGLTGQQAVRTTFMALALSSAFVYLWPPRQTLRSLARQFGQTFVLSSTMLVVVLGPLFYIGTTYLGAVNPDYFASFKDNHFLQSSPIFAVGSPAGDTYTPFFNGMGSMSLSARFGAALFAMLLEDVYGFTARTSLTMSIAIFLFCLPLTVYLMARVVFDLPHAIARSCAWLIGISGPIAMSFIYFYVGQNSGLAIVPLLLTLFYIAFTDPSLHVIILTTLVANSFFFMYLGMMPYACVPAVVLVIYLYWQRTLKVRTIITVITAFLVCFAILDAGIIRAFRPVFEGWMNIVGQSLQGQYFTAFLTEEFFPMFFGLGVYPLAGAFPVAALGERLGLPAMLAFSALLIFWVGFMILDWIRRAPDKRPVVYVLGGALIYGANWWIYTFNRQYGYAVFKMSSWLQFLLAIVYGMGLYRTWTFVMGMQRGPRRLVALIGCFSLTILIIGGNLITSLQYAYQGVGTDPERGYIVNNFEMSGNYDYFDLEPALEKVVRPNESVGLALSDVIQNDWTAYYLRKFRLSLLSHYLFPGDDENLPNIISRRTVDYYGNQSVDFNQFFHGPSDTYILTASPEHLNSDIVDQPLPKPVWKDRTFELLRSSEVKDFLYTGRGFYRIERLHSRRPYWWPGKWRWASEGGEFYLIHRGRPAGPYRLSFLALVGYGLPSARRHLEIWMNQRKIQEIEINGNARVITIPFFPENGVNLFVVRAKERVRTLPRPAALWNKSIPEDYRGLNFAMSSVKLIAPDDSTDNTASVILRGNNLISDAVMFDGMELDGWVREAATLSYVRPPTTSSVEIEMSIPPAIPEPCLIEFEVDGKTHTLNTKAPGPVKVTFAVPRLSENALTRIGIRPCKAIYPAGYRHDLRPVLQSVQLRTIEFGTTDDVQATARNQGVEQIGIDADGWLLHSAVLRFPSGSRFAEIQIEFPGWAGQEACNLDVLVNGKQVLHRNMTPGVQRLKIPLAPAASSSVELEADTAFSLPRPDSRFRSLRIISFRGVT